ncbi:ribosomal RNA large subunit methyltransferase K/L [Methanobrevibacter curvatus]|uniref:tRNA (guanine(10)-N(2))-dimethyltransferase n=2 Tax=Methanobrevibacter curvatus TaxID=49547 RepID=A0A166B1C1_9EURY|nr:ribosomal RNA large subunit methyltransferase K/L [Methanobrevibacter curvatus]
MELIIIQSQEHETLPHAELKAVMECENVKGDTYIPTKGLTIIKNLNKECFDENYKILNKRLAYAHEINEIIFKKEFKNSKDLNEYLKIKDNEGQKNKQNKPLNDLYDEFKKIDLKSYLKESFAIRIKKYDKINLDTLKIEKKLGAIIKNNYPNVKVKLENPKTFIRIIITEKSIYIGYMKYKLNKKHFQEMKPHKRPFFYPGSMNPKLARAMVNLSKIKEGETLLDPFCGTGGILIEGGMIGAKLIGSDISWKMKNGTGINLNHCGFSHWTTHHLDVRELKLYDKVDAVVTDPPYGISTSTGGEKSEIIFKEFLDSISKNMKKNALLCMASPHYLNLDEILKDLDFKLIDRHEIKMHKSLTRIISVIVKIESENRIENENKI